MEQILNELILFLKKPTAERAEIQTAKQKVKILLVVLIIDLIIAGIVSGVFAIIQHFELIAEEDHILTELLEQLPVWLMLLFTILIAPFLEELVFRFPLSFKYNYFLRFTILLSYIAGKQNKIKFENWMKNIWINNFHLIFYLSAFVFALIHLSNYKISIIVLVFAPILISSQFAGGVLLGYLRVRYNFILAVILHAVFNGILISLGLIFMTGTLEKLNIENEIYSIKIEEVSQRENVGTSNYYYNCDDDRIDSINFTTKQMQDIICYLLDRDEKFIETNNSKIMKTKLNLNFINHSKNNSECKEIILKHLSDLYNFKVEYNNRIQEVFELCIADTSKLMKYKTKTPNEVRSLTKTSGERTEIEMRGFCLGMIAHNLTTSSDTIIRYSLKEDTNRYDLTIPAGLDFKMLQNFLFYNLGLSLKKEKKYEIEYAFIKFEK